MGIVVVLLCVGSAPGSGLSCQPLKYGNLLRSFLYWCVAILKTGLSVLRAVMFIVTMEQPGPLIGITAQTTSLAVMTHPG